MKESNLSQASYHLAEDRACVIPGTVSTLTVKISVKIGFLTKLLLTDKSCLISKDLEAFSKANWTRQHSLAVSSMGPSTADDPRGLSGLRQQSSLPISRNVTSSLSRNSSRDETQPLKMPVAR